MIKGHLDSLSKVEDKLLHLASRTTRKVAFYSAWHAPWIMEAYTAGNTEDYKGSGTGKGTTIIPGCGASGAAIYGIRSVTGGKRCSLGHSNKPQ